MNIKYIKRCKNKKVQQRFKDKTPNWCRGHKGYNEPIANMKCAVSEGNHVPSCEYKDFIYIPLLDELWNWSLEIDGNDDWVFLLDRFNQWLESVKTYQSIEHALLDYILKEKKND